MSTEEEDNNVHTGESRSLKFNPAMHRAFITPIADGNQMIDVLPTDHPQPPASREIEPVA